MFENSTKNYSQKAWYTGRISSIIWTYSVTTMYYKLFEKLLLERLEPLMSIPDFPFEFSKSRLNNRPDAHNNDSHSKKLLKTRNTVLWWLLIFFILNKLNCRIIFVGFRLRNFFWSKFAHLWCICSTCCNKVGLTNSRLPIETIYKISSWIKQFIKHMSWALELYGISGELALAETKR